MGATSFPNKTLSLAIQSEIQTLTEFAGKKTIIVPELDMELIPERRDIPRAPFTLVFVKKSVDATGRPFATYLGVFDVTIRVTVDRLVNMKLTLHDPKGLEAQLELVKSKVVSSFIGLAPTTPGEAGKLLTPLEWRDEPDYDTLDEWIWGDVLLRATYPEDGFADNA